MSERKHIFATGEDDYRAVTMREDGTLLIEGGSSGDDVEHFFHSDSYHFDRLLGLVAVADLRDSLGLSPEDDLLAAIAERFRSSYDLEKYLQEHHIKSTFWTTRER